MKYHEEKSNAYCILIAVFAIYILFYSFSFEIKRKMIESYADSISQEIISNNPSLHESVLPFIDCGSERQKRKIYFFKPFDFSFSSLADFRDQISTCAKETDLAKNQEKEEINKPLIPLNQGDPQLPIETFQDYSSSLLLQKPSPDTPLEITPLPPENAYPAESERGASIEASPSQENQSPFSVIRPRSPN